MPEAQLHVVFGAGQVGWYLARDLLTHGARVRVVKRSPGDLPEGVETLLGDATDPRFCEEAARGADVVYHCMNPAYDTREWAQLLPRFLENLIGAAGRVGARLVVMENLYMVGRGGDTAIDEETPMNPESRKGEIRARLAEQLFEAHERGDVRAVSGRASDYYGPRGVGTHFGGAFWRPALKGKRAAFLPDADTPHSYHYIPDVGCALSELGRAEDDVLGRHWMLPCAPGEPSRSLVARFERVLGQPIELRGIPRPVVRLLGLFMPMLGEIGEMLHQWDEPFVVDDRRYRARFGGTPTAPDVGAAATVAWAREQFARAG